MGKKIKIIVYILTAYMLFTYLLAFIGPAVYDFKEPIKLTAFVMLYIISFFLGTLVGIREKSNTDCHSFASEASDSGLKISLIILLTYTIIAMIYNMAATGTYNIKYALINSLSSPDTVYYARSGLEANSVLNFFTIIFSPIFVFASMFGLIKFKTLSKKYKIIYILFLVFEVIRWIVVGTNKGLFDVVILLIVGLTVFKEETPNKTKKKTIKMAATIVLSFIIAIWFFGTTIKSRLGINFLRLNGSEISSINYNHIIFSIFPNTIAIIIIRFINYLVQGYYGLSLGLTLDFEPTYFSGWNGFLSNYLAPLYSFDINDRLYQTRIESLYGWSATAKWHTMYLWFANDVGFVGVVIVMLLIGYLLGHSLRDGLYNRNPYSICLCYLLIKTIMYSSANNQVLGTYYIVTVIIFYILSKKKKNYVFKLGTMRITI